MLWASTGTKDPAAPPLLYVEALAAPGTIDTMPDKTLAALAQAERIGAPMPDDGGHAEDVLAEFRREGVDDEALAERLQREGGESFAKSWGQLMGGLQRKIDKVNGSVGTKVAQAALH
jgi:transaldolase